MVNFVTYSHSQRSPCLNSRNQVGVTGVNRPHMVMKVPTQV